MCYITFQQHLAQNFWWRWGESEEKNESKGKTVNMP